MMCKRCVDDATISIRMAKIRREYIVIITRGTLNCEVYASTNKADAISEWVKWR